MTNGQKSDIWQPAEAESTLVRRQAAGLVPATAQPMDTSTVKPSPNLSEDKAAVQERSIQQLKTDPQGFVNRYRLKFDDHFNPDNAAELFPDYGSSAERRSKYRLAVAAVAGWFSDEAFKQRLAEPDRTPVLFTAGGTASGKSTIAGPATAAGLIVFDSTLSNTDLSKRRLQEALDTGRNIEVCYIYRDPIEAWDAAEERSKKEGAGRSLTPGVHTSTHEGAAKTATRLASDFAGNPQVEFRYFENSTAQGIQPGGIELTRKGGQVNSKGMKLTTMIPSAAIEMPTKIPQEQLAKLTREELRNYVDRSCSIGIQKSGGSCHLSSTVYREGFPNIKGWI